MVPSADMPGHRTWSQGLLVIVRDALLLSLVAAVVGLLVNLVHPEGIPFFATEPYQILVPCTEKTGEVGALEPGDPLLKERGSFWIDARSAKALGTYKHADAMNIPYDYLEPIPEKAILELTRRIGTEHAARLIVYGDGENPDSGEQMARELAGAGILNVFFVKGGAKALGALAPAGGQP